MTEESCQRRTTSLRLGLILVVGLTVLASACGFIVSETESALVLRFGKPVRVANDADIQGLAVVEGRTWKVADPLVYHVSVGNAANATTKLDALVTSARNSVLGRHPFGHLVAAEGREPMLEELEQEMVALAAGDAREHLGIELLSTGISRIQLPEANTESVFRRMRAERKREATQLRAEGRAKATEMKAETDKEATGLIADAKRQAEEIRGRAEADAAAIYARAHGEAPEFYRFLREMQSLRTVVDKNTTVVLDTGVAPFHWLKETDVTPPDLKPRKPSLPLPQEAPALTDHPTSPVSDR